MKKYVTKPRYVMAEQFRAGQPCSVPLHGAANSEAYRYVLDDIGRAQYVVDGDWIVKVSGVSGYQVIGDGAFRANFEVLPRE